jgi:benzoate/toluate 1,2-dioxygenase subunit alpha
MTAHNPFDVSPLIDDRAATEGVFRVDRGVYLDGEILQRELDVFFENGWVYLCHESQIPEPGDYFSTHMGRQPVFVNRRKDGGVGACINACAHRAAILTPFRQGNAKVFTCRFHGWAYDDAGKCIRIKGEQEGYPQPGFDRACFDLKTVPLVESYRGFVFGSLSRDVPTLAEHLGDARVFMDFFTDQSPDGIEVLRGSQTYVCDHDWKLQVENVPDGYHVSTVHRNFMNTVLTREAREGYAGMDKTETGRMKGNVRNGCYDLGRGHSVIWAERADPDAAPLYPATAEVEARCGPVRAEWMLRRGRNLCVFPNMVLNDLASTHLRCHRPLGPGRCEVTIWCIAPKGEPREARIARLRKFEDFFLVTGMATSDDVISLDVAHEGSRGRAARWTEFGRGMATVVHGPDEDAKALGIHPLTSNSSWDFETMYHGLYRFWRDRLNEGPPASAAQAAE